jgi:hypothetical protein
MAIPLDPTAPGNRGGTDPNLLANWLKASSIVGIDASNVDLDVASPSPYKAAPCSWTELMSLRSG